MSRIRGSEQQRELLLVFERYGGYEWHTLRDLGIESKSLLQAASVLTARGVLERREVTPGSNRFEYRRPPPADLEA